MKEKHIPFEDIGILARSVGSLDQDIPALTHIRRCLECRNLWEDAIFTKAALAPLKTGDKAPASLRRNIESLFLAPAERSSWLQRLLRPGWVRPAFAAALLLLVLGTAYIWRVQFSKLDDPLEVAWVIDLDDEYLNDAPALSEDEAVTLQELDEVSTIE